MDKAEIQLMVCLCTENGSVGGWLEAEHCAINKIVVSVIPGVYLCILDVNISWE